MRHCSHPPLKHSCFRVFRLMTSVLRHSSNCAILQVYIYSQYSFVVIYIFLYTNRAYLSLYFPLIFKATFSDMSQVMFSPLLWELDKFHYLLPTTNKHRPRSRITSNRLYACTHSVPCTVHTAVEATLGISAGWYYVVYSNHLMIRIISSSSFHVSITSLKSGKINFD